MSDTTITAEELARALKVLASLQIAEPAPATEGPSSDGSQIATGTWTVTSNGGDQALLYVSVENGKLVERMVCKDGALAMPLPRTTSYTFDGTGSQFSPAGPTPISQQFVTWACQKLWGAGGGDVDWWYRESTINTENNGDSSCT